MHELPVTMTVNGEERSAAVEPRLTLADFLREVTTIEGIASPDGELSPVQSAFRDCHGLQCGFCTPGFVTSVTAFLRDNPAPSDEEIRDALAGNLCRCTGYQGIIRAVRQAAGTTP